MATIIERKGKRGTTYKVEIRMKGVPKVKSQSFKRKSDAQRWALQTEAQIREGKYFKTAESRKRTLEELINKYEEQILPLRKRDKKTVEGQLLWWKNNLGRYHLADLTPQLISDYRDKLAQEEDKNGKRRSNGTVIRYLATLSVCLSFAVRDLAWMDENPVLKVRKPSLPPGRDNYLTDEERISLLDACKVSTNPYLHTVVVLALATGARKNEIMSLTWQDIDLKNKVMYLRETKNGERRTIPLARPALKELKAFAKKNPRRIDTKFLFPRADGKKPMDIRKYWERAVEKAGLKEKDFHFHDLRHSTATLLMVEGFGILDIAAILGHKTLAMVKRYSHHPDKRIAEILEKVNEKQFKKRKR